MKEEVEPMSSGRHPRPLSKTNSSGRLDFIKSLAWTTAGETREEIIIRFLQPFILRDGLKQKRAPIKERNGDG